MAYNPETMSFDIPDTDTVYVSGLPPNTTEQGVAACPAPADRAFWPWAIAGHNYGRWGEEHE